MRETSDSASDRNQTFLSVHICMNCGGVARREERDGSADANGVFHCSACGHAGPLNDQVIAETDSRLARRSAL